MSGREGRGIGVIEKDEEQERWRKTRDRRDGGRRGRGAVEEDEG